MTSSSTEKEPKGKQIENIDNIGHYVPAASGGIFATSGRWNR
jgi:hypothetical protein